VLVDTHSHFDVGEFDPDRAAVLERARAAGVAIQIVPAIAASGWEDLRALCARERGLHPAYGLHPTFLQQHLPDHLDQLGRWIERERPCAIGECGLDHFVEGLDPERQRLYFIGQLDLARSFDLPLILHARRAVDEVILALRRIGGLRGVVHSFSGSEEQARQLWSLGFHLGIGGPVTYERANRLRGIVGKMPLEWLLLETDSPDQPLCGHRGARNEPAFLVEIADVVARLRGTSVDELAAATTANAKQLFGIGDSIAVDPPGAVAVCAKDAKEKQGQGPQRSA
jgi:TatD DNase family protein